MRCPCRVSQYNLISISIPSTPPPTWPITPFTTRCSASSLTAVNSLSSLGKRGRFEIRSSSFHRKPFDDATKLKLGLFRSYLREWIPVFLTKQPRNHPVHIFDFFSGPGKDSNGESGSPLIIIQELQAFCEKHEDIRVNNPCVTLHFSDKDRDHISNLEELLETESCMEECCKIETVVLPFNVSLAKAWPIIENPSNACLVLMDQCGLKEVTPFVVNRFSKCRMTDILFFISSSYIRRFASEPSIQKHFDMSAEELQKSEYRTIHRYICDYFRSKLPSGFSYHLVPFSIKKSANIFGLIFGTGSYRGLEKFLKACWEHDGVTGEANYPVDEDSSLWDASKDLFSGVRITKKFDLFRKELEDFIKAQTKESRIDGASNHDLFEFTLGKGFLPKHARGELKSLQDDGILDVISLGTKKHARKGSFYISWGEYRDRRKPPKVVLRMDD